jgi:FixJ family two-component response regulator
MRLRQQAQDLGAVAFLGKPFNTHELLEAVARCFGLEGEAGL